MTGKKNSRTRTRTHENTPEPTDPATTGASTSTSTTVPDRLTTVPASASVPDRSAASDRLTASDRSAVPNRFEAAKTTISAKRATMPPAYAVNIPVKNIPAAATPKKDKKKKPSFFYAGLLAAPDLSTVKMQSVKGMGTTFGLLLGYQLNAHWAIETGIYDDRKKYYTEGDYFDKSKMGRLRYANLLNVDGVCNMWEIPINIRYNLNTSDRIRWFATAGLSTYLMTHENYDYQYNWNGGTTMTSSWQGANTSKYPFSILNLSFGYEQRLGKIGNLRLEPYIRVPLGGIGTGNLPIMSAGLNIGLTRKLW